MISKEIIYSGKKVILACDGNCNKAWGISNRKTILLDEEDVDDVVFLSDNELPTAPVNPGTYEGEHGKPTNSLELLNKWCCRQCERSSMFNIDEKNINEKLKNFSKRVYNIPVKTIYLTNKENEAQLIGFDKGKIFYEKYLKNKICLDRNHIIKIDNQIKDIDISFINGVIEGAIFNGMDRKKLKEIIKFEGSKNIVEQIKL